MTNEKAISVSELMSLNMELMVRNYELNKEVKRLKREERQTEEWVDQQAEQAIAQHDALQEEIEALQGVIKIREHNHVEAMADKILQLEDAHEDLRLMASDADALHAEAEKLEAESYVKNRDASIKINEQYVEIEAKDERIKSLLAQMAQFHEAARNMNAKIKFADEVIKRLEDERGSIYNENKIRSLGGIIKNRGERITELESRIASDMQTMKQLASRLDDAQDDIRKAENKVGQLNNEMRVLKLEIHQLIK